MEELNKAKQKQKTNEKLGAMSACVVALHKVMIVLTTRKPLDFSNLH